MGVIDANGLIGVCLLQSIPNDVENCIVVGNVFEGCRVDHNA